MKIDSSYHSDYGWYIVTVLERFERLNEDTSNPNRRCTAWENTLIVKADSILLAYDKVVKEEKKTRSSDVTELNGHKGRWVFEGIIDILPIYEEFEDMAELIWKEHRRVAVKTVKSQVYTRKEIRNGVAEKKRKSDS